MFAVVTLFCLFSTTSVLALNKCATTNANGEVKYVTDGDGNRRCYASITPKASNKLAVLFYFHGSGGNAGHCGEQRSPDGSSLGDLAAELGFALVCGEAIQDGTKRGQWRIPQIQTDKTGPVCGTSDSPDVTYMHNIVNALGRDGRYDVSRIFTSGCSMGSGFSGWASVCLKQSSWPGKISAFATHSTGLKMKGDGLGPWPRDPYTGDQWAECDGCQYFPMVPGNYTAVGGGLKACLFDNYQDPSSNNPYFYKSTVQLNSIWTKLGNRAETHFADGGHCQIHSFRDIVTCLDDNTNTLVSPKIKQAVY